MTEPTDKPLLDDQQLDEYLKGDSSVSRQYRQLPRADVPPSLDRLVLRQAEDAVKRPSPPAWMRWAKPLAVAASAVLVVSIVVETGLKDETMVTSQAPIETRMIEESAGSPPPPPKLETPPPVVYVDPVQSSAPVLADAAPIMPEPAAAAPAPAPEMEGRIVAREPADASIDAQLAKSEQDDKAAFAADESRKKSAREEAPRALEQVTAQRSAQPTAVLSYSRPISSNAVDNMATIKKTYTDPEAWLKDIRQLRKDNKQEEADREWRRFREVFPDYEVAETDAAREGKK
ncbi:hypothetical protein ACFPN2_18110 [Steroidobacter flavus]|uniref:Uncharacterized protein n=1 Tax=Steroidobacter flavus TaxID=1842136 RepID=A0ABV8SU67_9GAMM